MLEMVYCTCTLSRETGYLSVCPPLFGQSPYFGCGHCPGGPAHGLVICTFGLRLIRHRKDGTDQTNRSESERKSLQRPNPRPREPSALTNLLTSYQSAARICSPLSFLCSLGSLILSLTRYNCPSHSCAIVERSERKPPRGLHLSIPHNPSSIAYSHFFPPCRLNEKIFLGVMILMERMLLALCHFQGADMWVIRWQFLKKGMEHIFTRLEEGLTYSKYMDLYTYSPCDYAFVLMKTESFTTFARITRW